MSSCSKLTSAQINSPLVDSNMIEGNPFINEAACTFNFYQGDSAPAQLPEPNIKNSMFNKKFDLNLLKSVLNVSASELVMFAKLTGVSFYKIDNPYRNSCLFTENLPEAHTVLKNYFETAEKNLIQIDEQYSNSQLLGLYISKKKTEHIFTNDSLSNNYIKEASIVVKNDSDKYVMIHEYMHHVYNLSDALNEDLILKNAENAGLNFLKLFDLTQEQKEKIQSFGDLQTTVNSYLPKSAEDYSAHVESLENMTNKYIEVLKAFTLEEIAIENELALKFEMKELQFVDKRSREIGDKYISAKAKELHSDLEIFSKLVDAYKLKENFFEQEDNQVSSEVFNEVSNEVFNKMRSKLNSISQRIFDIKAEVAFISNKAKIRLKSNLYGLVSVENEKKFSATFCSHGRVMKKIKFNQKN